MEPAPVLKTERLLLRGIEEDDARYIAKLRSDPGVYRYFRKPCKLTLVEHLQWYRNSYIKDQNRIDWIAVSSEGACIGIFGVKRAGSQAKEAEVSYILSPSYYKMGYAREAVERMIEFCRTKWGVIDVIADIHAENTDSRRFAEKTGFREISRTGDFIRYKKEAR